VPERGLVYHLQLTAEEAARVVETDLSDFVWADDKTTDELTNRPRFIDPLEDSNHVG
jgi:hypothetical protein